MMRNTILAILCALIIAYPFSVSLKVLDNVWYKRPYIDEMFWIPVSNIAFQNFFITRDFSKETWDQEYYSWGNYNPTIGKFIMGLFIYWWGDSQWRTFPVKAGTEELTDKLAFPTAHTFLAARLPNFILACLSCGLLFLIVHLCIGLKEGVLSALLFAYNPIVRFVSHLAVVDFYVMSFGLSSTILFILLIKRMNKKSVPVILGVYTPAVGVLAGLCIGSKLIGFLNLLNMVLLLTIAWVFCCSAPWCTRKLKSMCIADVTTRHQWLLPLLIIVIVAVSLSTFIFSNPFLYRDTIDNVRHMYSHKSSLEKRYAAESLSFKEKFTLALGKRLLGNEHTLYIKKFHRLSILCNFLLTMTGLCCLCFLILKNVKSRNYTNATIKLVLLSWCVLYFAGTLWWVPKDWYRWLMSAIPSIVILESIGIVYSYHYAHNLLLKRSYSIGQEGA